MKRPIPTTYVVATTTKMDFTDTKLVSVITFFDLLIASIMHKSKYTDTNF